MRPPSPKQREALKIVARGAFVPGLVREEDGWYARWRPLGGENGWVDEYVRAAAMTPLSEDAEEQRHETLHDAWLMALKSRTGRVAWDDAACVEFARELDAWSGAAEEDVVARRSIVFSFHGGSAPGEPFILTAPIPGSRRGLRALGQSVFVFPPLGGLRRADGCLSVRFSQAEAESFVRSAARDLADAGYVVEGADLGAIVDAAAEIGREGDSSGRSVKKPSAALELTVRVAGEKVSAEEIRFLLDQGSSLVFFRNRWIEVDRDILRQALRALERSGRTGAQPLAFALGIGRIGSLEIGEVRAHGWLRGLVGELKAHRRDAGGAASASAACEPVPGLAATLRDYQRRGVEWMRFLTDNGFGALLADDMGLGKTVQTIAWILLTKPTGPVLVVAPLTLLGNWAHEFAKFAPGLRLYIHQGEKRHLASGFHRAATGAEVTLTSYSLLVRDHSAISGVAWSAMVLDEAQVIKNPDTQVARAVRALTPPRRIALTGTPVENSLADVWSLEEFLNPGFLGDRKSFFERFVKPVALDERAEVGRRLRHALEPFVLRRLKTDEGVAAELGPKREIKEYCRLTAEQRREYETALAEYRAGERRQGDIFALLTALKLVCDGEGKLERLIELVGSIFEAGESCLVFTQYVKVGRRLQEALGERFGRRIPFLHGGLSAAAREEEIARFNRSGATAFVLSLRAGGFGLNLTKATHVIHYDRWWNPAVENQATDRVHRIGQMRTVFVHPFIVSGTVEERVDEILERKQRISGTLVESGEKFLSELSENDFFRIVALENRP